MRSTHSLLLIRLNANTLTRTHETRTTLTGRRQSRHGQDSVPHSSILSIIHARFLARRMPRNFFPFFFSGVDIGRGGGNETDLGKRSYLRVISGCGFPPQPSLPPLPFSRERNFTDSKAKWEAGDSCICRLLLFDLVFPAFCFPRLLFCIESSCFSGPPPRLDIGRGLSAVLV